MPPFRGAGKDPDNSDERRIALVRPMASTVAAAGDGFLLEMGDLTRMSEVVESLYPLFLRGGEQEQDTLTFASTLQEATGLCYWDEDEALVSRWVPVGLVGCCLLIAHCDPNIPLPEFPRWMIQPVLVTERDYLLKRRAWAEWLERTLPDRRAIFPVDPKARPDLQAEPPSPDRVPAPDKMEVMRFIYANGIHREDLRKQLDGATKLRDIRGEDLPEGYAEVLDKVLNPTVRICPPQICATAFAELVSEDIAKAHNCATVCHVGNSVWVVCPRPDPSLRTIYPAKLGPAVKAAISQVFQVRSPAARITALSNARRSSNAANMGMVISTGGGSATATGGARTRRSVNHVINPKKALEANPYKNPDLEAPVLLDWALAMAAQFSASDLHFEKSGDIGRLRLRIDGDLQTIATYNTDRAREVCQALKTMAGMQPTLFDNQDGALVVRVGSDNYQLRISALAVDKGQFQKLVIRMQALESSLSSLAQLNLNPNQSSILRRAIGEEKGIIIVSGPTGSGKTTTLYAAIREINTDNISISTIEDPIEIDLPGIAQTQIDVHRGVTFDNVMSTIVRQDPDVIFLGELRDELTVNAAIQASLTGHLVFATIHANNALAIIPRVIQFGAKPFLFADAVLMLQAQRLVKRVCPECARKIPVTDDQADVFKIHGFSTPPTHVKAGAGCKACFNTGNMGRLVVMEMLPFTTRLKAMLEAGRPQTELTEEALKHGFKTMYHHALQRVINGEISIAQANTVADPSEVVIPHLS